jgi:peptidoglycan/xylan/chitin deacetylase (PgdA/CDA1 family)
MPSAALAPALPRWPWPPFVGASLGVHAFAGGGALLVPEALPWALAAVAVNHGVLGAAGLWPKSRLLGPNLTRLPEAGAARGQVALTFDDGPDPEVTPRALDLLDAAGARATFFCIAERAQAQPALVREIVARGHDVQNHSNGHAHHFSLLGPRGFEREIAGAQRLIEDLTGRRAHCFRAPAGLRNPLLDPVLHRLNLHLVSWTRRGFDTRDSRAERVAARLLRGLAGGDILLLHDGNSRDGVVLRALPLVLERLRECGLHPVTLRDAVPPRHHA